MEVLTMKLIDRERGSGKTTKLIYTSEMTGYPIVTQNSQSVEHIIRQAQELGAKIPKPMTVKEMCTARGIRFDKILIDEGFSIIENALKAYFNGVGVATVTFTSNDYNNTFG